MSSQHGRCTTSESSYDSLAASPLASSDSSIDPDSADPTATLDAEETTLQNRKARQQVGESTEECLRRRAEFVIDCINNRRFEMADTRLVSPSFVDTSERKNGTEKQTAKLALAYMMQHVQAHPNYRLELRGTTMDIDESKGTAKVYAQIGISDSDEGVELESMSILDYRRSKERTWILTKHYGMRGVASLPV